MTQWANRLPVGRAIGCLVLVLLIVGPVATSPHLAGDAERSLHWAERLLVKGRSGKPREHNGWSFNLENAEVAFAGIIARYGDSVRSLDGLGSSRLGLGNYHAAIRSFQGALKRSPIDPVARKGLQAAQDRLRVTTEATPQLSSGQRVLQIEEFPRDQGCRRWLILSAEPAGVGWHYWKGKNPRLSLWEEDANGLHRRWLSPVLSDLRIDDEPWYDIHLDVFDYTGDGIPEAAVWQLYMGASVRPCHLTLFRLDGQRLVRLIGISSIEDFRVADIDGDGRYEIGNMYWIGKVVGRPANPGWEDLYAFDRNRGGYVLANRSFLGEFRHWLRDLRKVLHPFGKNDPCHTLDPEISEYLGLACEMCGQPRAAARHYRAAARSYTQDDSWRRARVLRRLSALCALRSPRGGLRRPRRARGAVLS